MVKDSKNIKRNDCPNANYIMKTGFYIPSGNTISDQDIDYVSEQILKLKKKFENVEFQCNWRRIFWN